MGVLVGVVVVSALGSYKVLLWEIVGLLILGASPRAIGRNFPVISGVKKRGQKL